MKLGSAWAYVGMIRRHGLTRTVRIIRDRINERYHERRLGIETAAFVEMRELGIEKPGHLEYAPTPFRDFRAMLDRLAVGAGADVFLDYGSGKGRALIMAAQYPFRRILGVEFSPQLSLIAARNIELARRRFVCGDVQTIVADAATFEVPDDVTVAYFNNPFERQIFDAVLEQLRRSMSSHPRRVRLVVNYPLGVEPTLLLVIKQTDWLTIEDEFEPSPDRGCVIASNAR